MITMKIAVELVKMMTVKMRAIMVVVDEVMIGETF